MALFESYERRINQITPVLEKYGMNKRGRGRPRKSEDKGSSSSPQKRNMGHRGRPKKAQ